MTGSSLRISLIFFSIFETVSLAAIGLEISFDFIFDPRPPLPR
jgi:hypothetical protein